MRTVRLLALTLFLASPASAKELRWKSLDVKAKLDASGVLSVVEIHDMVFDGDWNGGERTFRVFPGQSLALESVTRIDKDGTRHPMTQGDLSALDAWNWSSPNVLRWRSRLPSDPPFDHAELVYEIAYRLSGILVNQGGKSYKLDNDFAFPDREWPIDAFALSLTFDPAWKPEASFTGSVGPVALHGREGYVITLPLSYIGAGRPDAAARGIASPRLRVALLLLFGVAVLVLYFRWRARERELGRLAPLTPPGAIDAAWLSKDLFSLSPEEAGALWDEKVGAPEVSAVIARLVAEKKLSTEADGKKMTMRLLVPLDRFTGYDHDLVKALFFGKQETDTDAIKAHYKSSGFDPASKIEPGLKAKLAGHPDFQDTSPKPSRWATPLLFAAGLGLHLFAVLTGKEEPGELFGRAFFYLLVYGIGAACAWAFQKRIVSVDAHSPVFLWVPAFLFVYAWLGVRDPRPAPLWPVVGSLLLRLAVVNGIFNLAKTRNGVHRIARRKALASARAWFIHELGQRAPSLQDSWFPYVVAFGLTSEADHWFKAYGGAAAASAGIGMGSSRGGSSSGSSSSSGSGWSGGGGAFGGAGSSGSWAVAAGAIASGVASPSSSGGGGGGGGGGGSSGGGGGGGW
ncbi:MAG TPA: hypothetical protein VGO79_04335 [Thermoanaerobaculia bacterium]|jgi:uncharacterized membrane protein YgcG